MSLFKTYIRVFFFAYFPLVCSASPSNQETFFSQASQDKFVYEILYKILHKSDQGYYLEIGASEPVFINNTYFFEKNLGWKGISIDISEAHLQNWNCLRHNSLLIEDATKTDYASLFLYFPQVIDYLSLDVDGYYDVVLKKLPLNNYIFKVITIEHDAYRYGDVYKKAERKILTSYGYYLLCGDVSSSGISFEDWWIHPSAFPKKTLKMLKSLNLHNLDHAEIMKILLLKSRLLK